ncbi:ABC transporter permease [Clostridium sp. MSJ-4]|uniref:ABC transporter permease n=1 Tax=Clostridium simiarum TaxID=2841506 RepID=A0ABS6F1X2_9CLOT|nr:MULTISPECIES: methionine ABC transporter permease [Clostridium]MBU5592375.1 ABC transporter permease [Clostridium simiarum]
MIKTLILPALLETTEMVLFSTLFSVILGFILAIILVTTSPKGLKPNKIIYSILDFFINILRSMPFLILMISIVPLTKFIMGKSIGTRAAIVPLTIGAMPFAARVIESALNEVDPGIIEAAKSFGASTMQIIFKVIIKEAMPSIVSGITLTVINVIGYSAMAGAIGAGGLGDVAVRYGYHRFKVDVMIVTVITLIILVQLIQVIGNILYKKLSS